MFTPVKKVIAVLLLFALAYQCTGKLGVLAWYQANKQYIAEVLCENRDKPAMHCDGQCVLAQKLQQLEEKQPASESQRTGIVKAEIPQFLISHFLKINQVPPALVKHLSFYLIQYHFLLVLNPFHPPPYGSHLS